MVSGLTDINLLGTIILERSRIFNNQVLLNIKKQAWKIQYSSKKFEHHQLYQRNDSGTSRPNYQDFSPGNLLLNTIRDLLVLFRAKEQGNTIKSCRSVRRGSMSVISNSKAGELVEKVVRSSTQVQQQGKMSSIIDDMLFSKLKGVKIDNKTFQQNAQPHQSLEDLRKKIYLTSGAVVVNSDHEVHELFNKQIIQEREYCVRMRIEKKGRTIKVESRLLKNYLFRKINSKHSQLLLLREISKEQSSGNHQSTLYVHRGSIVLSQQIYLCLGETILGHRLSEFYNLIVSRNLNSFNYFINKHWDRCGQLVIAEAPQNQQLDQDLLLSQILNTTTNTFGIAEDSTQFKEIESIMVKKKKELQQIKSNIIHDCFYTKSSSFYDNNCQGLTYKWIHDNFQHIYNNSQKRYGNMLSMSRFSAKKKIDDYIFNTVKASIKQVSPKPFNHGGSCLLYHAKAAIIFVSSVDGAAYPSNEDNKDRIIALKKLRPDLAKKYSYKLEHEKNIITKLKGGCCYFIPKYYRGEANSQEGDSLMMEFIQGDELDFYMLPRIQTISLWTKLHLLLNVVHGLRFLSNYDIAHLDLKPNNILVCKQLITKIIDYGEAYHRDVCDSSYSPGFTFPYVAPEVLAQFQNKQEEKNAIDFNEKQDVFAFGMMMAEIIFNAKFFFLTNQKFKEFYKSEDVLDRCLLSPQKLQSFGDNRVISTLGYIMLRCLQNDPRKRPKFDWIGVSLKLILTTFVG